MSNLTNKAEEGTQVETLEDESELEIFTVQYFKWRRMYSDH